MRHARTRDTLKTVGRARLTAVGTGLAVAALAALSMTVVGASSAPAVAPKNAGEPRVSGSTQVGDVLRTTRGTWSGTAPFSYTFKWRRCQGRGLPDGSDCTRISNASDNTYVLPGGCRLQDPLAGDGVERRRSGDLDVQPDERRGVGAARQHEPADDLGHGERR